MVHRFIVGLIVVALGVIGLKFSYQIMNFTGAIDWIENKLGGGSTYTVIKIISMVMIIGGIIYMSGLGSLILRPIVTPINHLLSPQ